MFAFPHQARAFLCGIALLCLGGCAGGNASKAVAATSPGLLGTEWQLVSHGPKNAQETLPDDALLTVHFDADQAISGSSGCNNFRGQWQRDGEKLQISALSGTKKACPSPPGVMKLEQQFLNALTDCHDYRLQDDLLTLAYGSDGELVLIPIKG